MKLKRFIQLFLFGFVLLMFSESYATYTAAPPIKRRVKVTCGGENGGIARYWPDEEPEDPIDEMPLDIALGETATFANDGSIDKDTKDNATGKQYSDTLNPVGWSLFMDGQWHNGSGSLSYTFNESGYYCAPAEIDDEPLLADDAARIAYASVNVLPVDYVIVLPNPNQDPNCCAHGEQMVFTGHAYNHGPDEEPYFNQYGEPIDERADDDIKLGTTFDWSTTIGSVNPEEDSASTTFTADAGTGEGSVTATYNKCGNTKSGSAEVYVIDVEIYLPQTLFGRGEETSSGPPRPHFSATGYPGPGTYTWSSAAGIFNGDGDNVFGEDGDNVIVVDEGGSGCTMPFMATEIGKDTAVTVQYTHEGATASDSDNVTVVGVEIVDHNAKEFIGIGKEITLSANPSGPSPGTYEWSIPGYVGIDYEITEGSVNTQQIKLKFLTPGYKTIDVQYTYTGVEPNKKESSTREDTEDEDGDGETNDFVPDPAEEVVIRVDSVNVHSNDTDTHKISSVLPPEDNPKDHFVCAKETGDIILQAAITPNNDECKNAIGWEATGATITSPAVGDDKLTAKLPSDASKKIPVKIKVGEDVLWEGVVWVVWSTATGQETTAEHIVRGNVTDQHAPPQTGMGTGVQVEWDFEATITPLTMLTDADRPDFTGNKAGGPPNGVHVWTGNALTGGATTKWDMSRRVRIKALSPNVGTVWFGDPGGTIFDNLPSANRIQENFPANTVTGNDDTRVDDEDNTPDANGKVTSEDEPTTPVLRDAGGAVGDTVEYRIHYGEFLRLEIDGNWTRISDFFNWRLHGKLKKASESADDQDYNGDGDKIDMLWIDDGSVSDATNNGW